MNLYRYEFVKDGYRYGLLTGLDELFFDNDDYIFRYGFFFEKYLPLPDIDMCNTKSFFTEKGNRKFKKVIVKMKKDAKLVGIDLVCTVIDKKEVEKSILYQDVYQVILENYACVA